MYPGMKRMNGRPRMIRIASLMSSRMIGIKRKHEDDKENINEYVHSVF
jgi:hypothetical protein